MHEYIREYLKPNKKNVVQKLRIFNNLKQTDAVKETGISLTNYRHIELGIRGIKLNEEKKLATLFGVSVNQLYESEE